MCPQEEARGCLTFTALIPAPLSFHPFCKTPLMSQGEATPLWQRFAAAPQLQPHRFLPGMSRGRAGPVSRCCH